MQISFCCFASGCVRRLHQNWRRKRKRKFETRHAPPRRMYRLLQYIAVSCSVLLLLLLSFTNCVVYKHECALFFSLSLSSCFHSAAYRIWRIFYFRLQKKEEKKKFWIKNSPKKRSSWNPSNKGE